MRETAALRLMHEALWDPSRSMVRVAPGAQGRQDPALQDPALQAPAHPPPVPPALHAVRETALGSIIDFDQGRAVRANAALRAALTCQYDAPGTPWHGTFKLHAQDRDPGPGAVMWRDFDPNWRQFLGCILAFVRLLFAEQLDADVETGIVAALRRCVAGEPPDRLPAWYTNPNLLHAWLCAHVGALTDDAAMHTDGERRRHAVMQRFDAFGDVDEYNSPTYDGIDVLAAMLWVAFPPSENFEADGDRLLTAFIGRIQDLYHPQLAVTCGPYSRTYGFLWSEYVSLAGVLLRALGVCGAVLPTALTASTDHVHDLFFFPMFSHLLRLVPPLTFRPSTTPRSRRQEFGEVHAVSIVGERYCVGYEHGRIAEFARDQYAPAVIHQLDAAGRRWFVAVLLTDTPVRVRVGPDDEARALSGKLCLTVESDTASHPVRLRLAVGGDSGPLVGGSDAPGMSWESATAGPVTVRAGAVGTVVDVVRAPAGHVLTLEFAGPTVTLELTWAPRVQAMR